MPRILTVNGVKYLVTIGRSNVKIVSAGGQCAPFSSDVAGVLSDTFDRGQHKRTPDGEVTPARVAYWIRKNSWRFTPLKKEKTLPLRQSDYDQPLDFKGFHGGSAQCGIRIWTDGPKLGLAPTRYIVMMTELADNPGLSVTNGVEIIAAEVLRTLLPKADPETIVWIEHYPPRGSRLTPFPESFALVHLKYDGTKVRMANQNPWTHMGEETLKELGILG